MGKNDAQTREWHVSASSAALAATSKPKRALRVPLRFQITALLVVFVGSVAFASFRSTLSFLERDKTATLNVLQTLQVDQLSKSANERFTLLRRNLRDVAASMLDPARTVPVPFNDKMWSWVRVRDKVAKAADFKGEPPASPTDLVAGKFSVRLDSSGQNLILAEPFKVREGTNESDIFLEGQVSKKFVFGDPVDLDRGPVKGAVVDMSGLMKSGHGAVEAARHVWMGTETTPASFGEFFSSLDPSFQTALARPSTATSREISTQSGEGMLVSWATLPLANSDQNLVVASFVSKAALLAGFRRMVFELAFWAFLVLGAGVIAARFLANRLSRPIEDLVEASKQLETGDFKVRVKADRNDEIGDLAGAFNHMGQALEDRETALKSAQNALIQGEKLAAIGTLSAGIAHEVKNPLAGILGNAELASNNIKKLSLPNESTILKYVETISKETKRCQGIIDGLMRFSRSDTGASEAMEPMDLEIIAWEAIQLMEYSLSKSSVRIEKQFTDDVWMVKGTHNQVEQVLLNMYQNAGHAMANGGTLTVGTQFFEDPSRSPVGRFIAFESPEFQGPFVRLFVRDTGTGMSEEIQRKIFEPFFTTKARGVGTGLGLAVTMGILGDHKARVSLDSAPGEGTTFYLDFMAFQERTEKIRQLVAETRHRKAGGSKLSTDVGAVPPSYALSPSAPEDMAPKAEEPSEIASPKVPAPTLGDRPATPAIGAAKFAVRKPTIKG